MHNTEMDNLLVKDGIRDIEITRSQEGIVEQLSFCFGPHHFMHLQNKAGKIEFTLGVTHHGMTFDASEVGGELERAMNAMSLVCKPENLS